jgi:hypothetical protein
MVIASMVQIRSGWDCWRMMNNDTVCGLKHTRLICSGSRRFSIRAYCAGKQQLGQTQVAFFAKSENSRSVRKMFGLPGSRCHQEQSHSSVEGSNVSVVLKLIRLVHRCLKQPCEQSKQILGAEKPQNNNNNNNNDSQSRKKCNVKK